MLKLNLGRDTCVKDTTILESVVMKRKRVMMSKTSTKLIMQMANPLMIVKITELEKF